MLTVRKATRRRRWPMPLDPQVQALLERVAASGQKPIDELPIDEGRDIGRMLALFDGEPEPVAAVEDRRIPRPAGDIVVRVYRPTQEATALPAVAWFHAGGGVIGDLDTADRSCRKLANRSGAAIVSVDYRRAPEHRFPAADQARGSLVVPDCPDRRPGRWGAAVRRHVHPGRPADGGTRLA